MNMHVFIHSGAVFAVGLALIFAFSNGFRDSSTIVATIVSTRVLATNTAFILCAVFELIGALLVGSAVVSTMSSGILKNAVYSHPADVMIVIAAGLAVAIVWGLISWKFAWPTSNNHALVAGMAGASFAAWGGKAGEAWTVILVLMVLILSPIIGFLLATVVTAFIRYLGEWLTPHAKPFADGLQVISCMAVSCAHGSNDGQMVMGVLIPVFAILGFANGDTSQPGVPFLMRLVVALTLACGVLVGGRRIIRKIGMKFYRIRDLQGLGSQISSAGTILACTLSGLPASTTQVIAGSIIGAGVAKNPRAVRWFIAQEIVLSWIITAPVVALFSYLLCAAILGVL